MTREYTVIGETGLSGLVPQLPMARWLTAGSNPGAPIPQTNLSTCGNKALKIPPSCWVGPSVSRWLTEG